MLTDDKCWEILESVKWGTDYKTIDDTAVKFALAHRLGEEDAECLWRFFQRQTARVSTAINKWERATNNSVDLGDDSFGDLCAHIVGMGRAMVDEVVAQPEVAYALAVSGKFGESFAYCIPNVFTFRDRARLPEWKDRILSSLDDVKATAPVFDALVDEVRAIVENPESAALTDKDMVALWDRIATDAKSRARGVSGNREQIAMIDAACSLLCGWSHRNYVSDYLRWSQAVKPQAA